MNVSCPQCRSQYTVDEARIPDKGGRLTCTKCGTKWHLYRPGTLEMPARGAAAGPAPPAPDREEAGRGAEGLPPQDPGSTGAIAETMCPACGHEFIPGEAPRRTASPPPPPPAAGGKKTILLVEDQKYFAELTREALGPEYRTISVATKDEAFKVIEQASPSLMILDLSLARGQDGREILRSLRAKEFPILIFTARDETELYGEAWSELQALGADDVLHKGMNVAEELRRKVSRLLGR